MLLKDTKGLEKMKVDQREQKLLKDFGLEKSAQEVSFRDFGFYGNRLWRFCGGWD